MQKSNVSIFESLLNEAEKVSLLQYADSQNNSEEIKKPRFTISHLENYLKTKNIAVRYNVITHKNEILGISSEFSPECRDEVLAVVIFDELQHKYISITIEKINQFLSVIVAKNAYNPVTQMLDNNVWDKIDRLPQIYQILNLNESDELSKTLIKKWLIQCVSLAHNELDSAFGADGILVLTGFQGIGKTSFFKKLAVESSFFGEGKSINFYDKDTFRRVTSFWITELGEIETTLKSDIEKLKALITDSKDLYRLPYGRKDLEHARRASLCGTCNSSQYLIDPSGNRRFWSIPVDKIDLKKLSEFNSLQLWCQIAEQYGKKSQKFRLTAEEQQALSERNGIHEKPLKGENEVRDILYNAQEKPNLYIWQSMTISDFTSYHDRLKMYSAQQITLVLDKLNIPKDNDGKPYKIDGKAVRTRKLPRHNC